jgi:hypothetical protein
VQQRAAFGPPFLLPMMLLWEPVSTGDRRLFKAPVLTFRQHRYPRLEGVDGFSNRLPCSLRTEDRIQHEILEFRSGPRYIARFGVDR